MIRSKVKKTLKKTNKVAKKRSRRKKGALKCIGRCIECGCVIPVPQDRKGAVTYRGWCEHCDPMHKFLYGDTCPSPKCFLFF